MVNTKEKLKLDTVVTLVGKSVWGCGEKRRGGVKELVLPATAGCTTHCRNSFSPTRSMPGERSGSGLPHGYGDPEYGWCYPPKERARLQLVPGSGDPPVYRIPKIWDFHFICPNVEEQLDWFDRPEHPHYEPPPTPPLPLVSCCNAS